MIANVKVTVNAKLCSLNLEIDTISKLHYGKSVYRYNEVFKKLFQPVIQFVSCKKQQWTCDVKIFLGPIPCTTGP